MMDSNFSHSGINLLL